MFRASEAWSISKLSGTFEECLRAGSYRWRERNCCNGTRESIMVRKRRNCPERMAAKERRTRRENKGSRIKRSTGGIPTLSISVRLFQFFRFIQNAIRAEWESIKQKEEQKKLEKESKIVEQKRLQVKGSHQHCILPNELEISTMFIIKNSLTQLFRFSNLCYAKKFRNLGSSNLTLMPTV